MTPWEIHGYEVANCNCAYGCPCQFNALPTTGTCEAAVGFRIEKGNGERQIIIDEKASPEQRTALEKILSGDDTEPMATIQWVINAMTSTHHETLYKSVRVDGDISERTGRVVVDGVFQVDAEPIKNPVTGDLHRVRIDNPNGFEFTIAEMASGTTKTSGGDIDLPNNNQTHSHMCEIHWNNSGVIRN